MRGLPSRRQWVSECVEHELAPSEGRIHRYYANRGPMGVMWPVSSSMTYPSRRSEWRNLLLYCSSKPCTSHAKERSTQVTWMTSVQLTASSYSWVRVLRTLLSW
jgi:hypothetical protein